MRQTPSQPSPSNLSDELREKMTSLIDAYRIENNQRGMGMLDIEPTVAAITAAYAEAIRGCVPEKDNRQYAVKGVDQGIQIGRNGTIDTIIAKLKAKGLIL